MEKVADDLVDVLSVRHMSPRAHSLLALTNYQMGEELRTRARNTEKNESYISLHFFSFFLLLFYEMKAS